METSQEHLTKLKCSWQNQKKCVYHDEDNQATWYRFITACMMGNFSWFFLLSADIKKSIFQEYHHSVKKFESRAGLHEVLSSLVWVQTNYMGYQQTALAGKDLNELVQYYTVKPVLSGHSKKRPKMVFKTDYG